MVDWVVPHVVQDSRAPVRLAPAYAHVLPFGQDPSLDRASADQLIALLRGLTQEGIAVLVASHDEHLIEAADSRTTLT